MADWPPWLASLTSRLPGEAVRPFWPAGGAADFPPAGPPTASLPPVLVFWRAAFVHIRAWVGGWAKIGRQVDKDGRTEKEKETDRDRDRGRDRDRAAAENETGREQEEPKGGALDFDDFMRIMKKMRLFDEK